MCTLLEKADFLTGWGYQKMLSENVILEKAFSDNTRSGVLVPHQKRRFLVSFSNSIRSDLTPHFFTPAVSLKSQCEELIVEKGSSRL